MMNKNVVYIHSEVLVGHEEQKSCHLKENRRRPEISQTQTKV